MINPAEDLERRNLSFSQSKVREVLPEYFEESYPNLLLFLDKYYEYLEGENRDSFKTQINNLFVSRDPEQTDEASLDFLVEEFGNGLKSSSFFDNPRLMTALLSKFYRVKGSLASIEGFFRGFFGENVVVEYPKQNLFLVGDSKIGHDSLKFIVDNALYQTFSLLIKTPFSTADWRDLYLKFVHPAGFYYEGQVLTQTEKVLGLTSFSENPLAVPETPLVLSSEGFITLGTAFTQATALWDSNGDTLADYRFNLAQVSITTYQDVAVGSLIGAYHTIATLVTPNSFTFDDSDTIRPDFSLSLETMDNDMFTRYLSDSTF
jgi:hypothetical protein